MKPHDDMRERLSAYLDGELDARGRAEIEALLSTSAEARDELEALRELHAQLLEAPAHEPGKDYWSGFAARVESRLPQRARSDAATFYERLTGWLFPSGKVSWLRAGTAVASLTLVAFVGVRGFREVEPQLRPPALQSPSGESPGAAPPASSTRQPAREKARAATPAPATGGEAHVRGGRSEEGQRASDERDVQARAKIESVVREENVDALPDAAPIARLELQQSAPATPTEFRARAREVAPELRDAGRAFSREHSALAFARAAIAADTTAARAVYDQLVASDPTSSNERAHMLAWLQAQNVAPKNRVERSARLFASSRLAGDLQPPITALGALDRLLWPLRQRAEARATIEQLAREAADLATFNPAALETARRYLSWLADNSAGETARAEWRARLEGLPD